MRISQRISIIRVLPIATTNRRARSTRRSAHFEDQKRRGLAEFEEVRAEIDSMSRQRSAVSSAEAVLSA